MARSDRLFRLLQAMRVMPAPITAARLAEETGVSLRSLYRDIDSLRAAGALIEGERGYGYRLIEDYALPPQTFDRAEIEAIVLGLSEVRHMGDKTLADAAAAVLAKVAATLPSDREQHLLHAISQVYRPDERYTPNPHLELVRMACWDEKALDITYTDSLGAKTERTILPLAISYTHKTLTLLAWCELRNDFRMFRIERIASATALARSFRPRRVSLLREHSARLEKRTDSGQNAPNHPSS